MLIGYTDKKKKYSKNRSPANFKIIIFFEERCSQWQRLHVFQIEIQLLVGKSNGRSCYIRWKQKLEIILF